MSSLKNIIKNKVQSQSENIYIYPSSAFFLVCYSIEMGRKDQISHYQDIDKFVAMDDFVEVNDVNNTKKIQMEREREMIKKQLPNVPISKKLRPNDIHRIIQHVDNSLFDEEKCCMWTGYITNQRNKKKGTYINFYFRNKQKVALHRLLYSNFKGDISNQNYIKYSCKNKGECCNINHMVIFEYNAGELEEIEKSEKKKKKTEETENNEKKKYTKEDFHLVIY